MATQEWTKEKIIEELKTRSGGGRSIRFSPGKADDGLKDAVYKLYGSWPNVLRAAGLHPKTRLINYWTEAEVIKRIKELCERGESINTLHLEMKHPRLWNASRRIYGNIQKAVEAAGYDYGTVKKRGTWTRDSITHKIREYFEQDVDISQIAMLEYDSKLLAAGQKFYGAWSRAVRAAGIDYTEVKSRRKDVKRKKKATDDSRKKRKVFVMKEGRLVEANATS